MKQYSAADLYQISQIKPHSEGKRETIDEALWRAARSGSVELFYHDMEEKEIRSLTERGYDVERGEYLVGDGCYQIRIYWGASATGKSPS